MSRSSKHADTSSDDEVFGADRDVRSKHKLAWRSVVTMKANLGGAIEGLGLSSNCHFTRAHPERERVQDSRRTSFKGKLSIDLDAREDWRFSDVVDDVPAVLNMDLISFLRDTVIQVKPGGRVTPVE